MIEGTFFTMLFAMPSDRVGRFSAGLADHGKLVFLIGRPSEDGFQAALVCQDDDPEIIASSAELADGMKDRGYDELIDHAGLVVWVDEDGDVSVSTVH
jgi:hypothetical protein